MSRFLAAQASRPRDEKIQNSIRSGIPDDRTFRTIRHMRNCAIEGFPDLPKLNQKWGTKRLRSAPDSASAARRIDGRPFVAPGRHRPIAKSSRSFDGIATDGM
jgi:hypothetical protein